MASSSDSALKNPLSLTSKLSIPESCVKTLSSKIENLIEYSYVPEDAQIESSIPPLLSPYNVFRREKGPFRWLHKKLISTPRPGVKEYIQTTKMDECALQATSAEQYVDLEINPTLIRLWQREGYVSLHLGAIRLVLSLHGRKGLPITARVSLLDTTFQNLEHATIGTVLTTLNAGSVVLTMFPNFNVHLKDPTLTTRFKVQVQLIGAPQDGAALAASLQHQLIYRLQDHCFDLPTPKGFNENALMVLATSNDETPSIVQIPKQISKKDLMQLMPLEWISNYENFKRNSTPAVSTEASFQRSADGTVRTIFKRPDQEEPSEGNPPVFHTMMITPGAAEKKLPIHAIEPNGQIIFSDKIDGHFLLDIPRSGMCEPGCICHTWFYPMPENDEWRRACTGDCKRPATPCKPPLKPQRKSDPDNGPWVGIRKKKEPLPIYEEALRILRQEGYPPPPEDPDLITWPPPQTTANSFSCKSPTSTLSVPTAPEIPCMMFASTSATYGADFPALERKSNPTTQTQTKPFI